MKPRKGWMARASSLLGRQQRADARRIAHELTLQKDRTINSMGFKMPAPGPLTSQGKKRVQPFKNLAEARNYIADVLDGKTPKGLRYCAASDMVENSYKKGEPTNETGK